MWETDVNQMELVQFAESLGSDPGSVSLLLAFKKQANLTGQNRRHPTLLLLTDRWVDDSVTENLRNEKLLMS